VWLPVVGVVLAAAAAVLKRHLWVLQGLEQLPNLVFKHFHVTSTVSSIVRSLCGLINALLNLYYALLSRLLLLGNRLCQLMLEIMQLLEPWLLSLCQAWSIVSAVQMDSLVGVAVLVASSAMLRLLLLLLPTATLSITLNGKHTFFPPFPFTWNYYLYS
jgi:hypothetical protein